MHVCVYAGCICADCLGVYILVGIFGLDVYVCAGRLCMYVQVGCVCMFKIWCSRIKGAQS